MGMRGSGGVGSGFDGKEGTEEGAVAKGMRKEKDRMSGRG